MLVQSIPYPAGGGGGPPPADITFAVQDMVTGTTTGNVDYTSATISGLTPAAVLAFYGQQLIANEPNESAAAQVGVTAVTSGGGWHCRNFQMDNRNFTTSVSAWSNTAKFTTTNQSFSGFDFDGTMSLISGGARVNYSSATTSQRAFYLAFAGSNVAAKTHFLALGSSAATVSATAVGFEADVVIAFLPGGAGTSSTSSQYSPCVGVAVNEGGGTVVQRCIATHETGALDTGSVYQAILTGKIAAALNGSGGKVFDASAGNFTSSSYDITTSASAASRNLMLLALKFTGGDVKLVDFTTPTTTGNHAVTGAGFTPRLALVFLTNLESVDPTFPLTATDLMSGFSISVIGDEQWGLAARVDNNLGTSDTATRVKNVALLGANATTTNAIEASLVSFDGDGMTLNYSAVQATGKKGFILFIK